MNSLHAGRIASAIPVWVWVMWLFVVAWAVWYAARMWDVPASYAHSPTYSHEAASEASTRTLLLAHAPCPQYAFSYNMSWRQWLDIWSS